MLGEAGFPELTPDEYTYIQNNQYFGGQLLSYFYNNINQNNSQFYIGVLIILKIMLIPTYHLMQPISSLKDGL